MRPRRRAFWLLARVLVVSLVLLQAAAVSSFGGLGCLSGCAADDDGGRCSPACTECACCARAPVLAALPFAPLLVVAEPRSLASGEPLAMQAEVAGRVFRPPRLELSRARS